MSDMISREIGSECAQCVPNRIRKKPKVRLHAQILRACMRQLDVFLKGG